MTFSAQETSQRGGAPIELYEFKRGVKAWRYTSADEAQEYLAQTYAATPISRSQLSDLGELAKSELQVRVMRDISVIDQFRAWPPGEVVSLTIYQFHRTDGSNEVRVIWIGRVLNVRWEGSEASIICEPIRTSLKRNGLRRTYSRQCTHQLYGSACGVMPADYRLQGSISAINANVLSVPGASGQADGYFNGGFLWWQLPSGERDARMIIDHTGDAITLASQMGGISIGDAVELHPGCDHTMAQCESRFDNVLNYGGWPFTPGVNPFNGTVLY